MEWGSIAEIITAATAVVSASIALWQYWHANNVKRASYIETLLDKIKTDDAISEMIYKFQYSEFKYDSNFHGGEEERKIDRTLLFFNYICYLREKHIISKAEFSFFEIEISQALRSQDLIDYLYNLYHFNYRVEGYKSKSAGLENSVYSHLLKYANSKGLLPDAFFDATACRISGSHLHHYLNF